VPANLQVGLAITLFAHPRKVIRTVLKRSDKHSDGLTLNARDCIERFQLPAPVWGTADPLGAHADLGFPDLLIDSPHVNRGAAVHGVGKASPWSPASPRLRG